MQSPDARRPQNPPNPHARRFLANVRWHPPLRCAVKTAQLDILKIMPTPLSTAGAASGSDAWQELEEVLAGLGQLARSPIDPEQFYEHVLVECVRALSAVGGAAWVRTPTGALRPVAHVNWPGAEIAASTDARRAHEALLSNAATSGRLITTDAGNFIAPVQIARDDSHGSASSNVAASNTVAILELTPRADASPAAYRGYEQFLTAVCDLAAEYHAFRELARLRQNENYRDELVRLSTLVHRSIELTPTAYAVANEGRRVIGCDRLSVLAADRPTLASAGHQRREPRRTPQRRRAADGRARRAGPPHRRPGLVRRRTKRRAAADRRRPRSPRRRIPRPPRRRRAPAASHARRARFRECGNQNRIARRG